MWLMKKTMLLLIPLFLLGVAGCAPEVEKCPEVDLEKEMSEIRTLLEQYELARENEDFSTIEIIWANDDNILLIGTESHEELKGIDAIKKAMARQFNEFENTLINISDQKIGINKSGTTAWFYEMLDYNFIYQGEDMVFEGIRFTGVLEKRDGQWKLVQGHLSIPYEAEIKEEAR